MSDRDQVEEIPLVLHELFDALDAYALYVEEKTTLNAYRECINIESIMVKAIDALRMERLAASMPRQGPVEDSMRDEALGEVLKRQHELFGRLDVIRLRPLPKGDRGEAERAMWKVLFNASTGMGISSEIRKAFLSPDDVSSEWVMLVEQWEISRYLLFQFRHQVLEPVLRRFAEKRAERQSRSPLDGGRPCDVGVRSIIRAAEKAGCDMRRLAEELVIMELDRNQTGSTARRIAREAKRLAEAKRSMDKRASSTPKAVRSVGRKPS